MSIEIIPVSYTLSCSGYSFDTQDVLASWHFLLSPGTFLTREVHLPGHYESLTRYFFNEGVFFIFLGSRRIALPRYFFNESFQITNF